MARTLLTAPLTLYCAAGGNDSNPGTLALPMLNAQAAVAAAYNDYDAQGFGITIDISNAQSLPCNQSGPLVGTDQLIYNFSGPAGTYWISTTQCLILAEKAIAVLTGNPVTWVPDYPTAAGNQAAIYLHNDPTLDMFNGQNIFSGQAAGDNFIVADGHAIVTVQSGVKVEGYCTGLFQALRSSNWTISGEIDFAGANVKLYDWRSCSTLNLNASYGSTTGCVLVGSTATGNSVLNTNGTKANIPGGITSSTGAEINDSGSI